MIEEKEEIWRDIDGYPNYQVSTLGRVKSLNYRNTKKEKVLKPIKDKDGYLVINIRNEKKQKTIKIHRIVCEAFLPNKYNLQEVNHLDEDKTNNNVTNLEWSTREHNCNFGSRNERISKKVICIENGHIYPSTMDVERKLGFKHSSISACCNGKAKSCGGYHWQYV